MKTRRSTKKISAILLSLVLLLCMLPVTALAHQTSGSTLDGTTSGSLTINKTDGAGTPITDNSLEYTIYKVAEIAQTNNGGVVSVQYILDSGVTLTGGITGDGSTVTLPAGTTAADFTGGLPSGTAVANTGVTPGTLEFTGLPLGLYLVRETVTPAGVSQANDFLVSIPMSTTNGSGDQVWDYDPVAYPKNTVVDGTVSKTITGGATALPSGTNTWTASLGSTVAYEISAKLPSTFTVTPYTTYTITDIPAADLSIDLDGSGAPGSFDGIVVTATPSGGGTATTLVNGADYTITASGTGFVVELITDVPSGTTPGNQSPALTNGAVVTITYNAKLSPSATGGSFTNSVQVDSKYNTPGGPVTPPIIVPPPTDPPPVIVTYNYALQKVDGDNANAPLGGAVFVIREKISGEYLTWNASTGWGKTTNLSIAHRVTTNATDAIESFNGIAGTVPGTIEYELIEVAAPAGYSQLTAPVDITVDATSTNDADIVGGGVGYSIQIVNTKANNFVLPGTGGIGIYIFTIGGVLLIAAAIILLAVNRKKKRNAND